MTEEKLSTMWKMIEKECQRNGLTDLLEFWGLSLHDWYEFRIAVSKISTNMIFWHQISTEGNPVKTGEYLVFVDSGVSDARIIIAFLNRNGTWTTNGGHVVQHVQAWSELPKA